MAEIKAELITGRIYRDYPPHDQIAIVTHWKIKEGIYKYAGRISDLEIIQYFIREAMEDVKIAVKEEVVFNQDEIDLFIEFCETEGADLKIGNEKSINIRDKIIHAQKLDS